MDMVEQIKENFKNKKYTLCELPYVFFAENSDVWVFKNGRNMDEIGKNWYINWEEGKVTAHQLKVYSYGAFDFHISLVDTRCFDSHERVDAIYTEDWTLAGQNFSFMPIKRDRITLEDAMDLLTVKISCDMDYYLANRLEMEKDLGRSLDGLDLSDKSVLKQLHDEIFYKQMVDIFGDSSEDEQEIVLTDYRILDDDGNRKFATARRGNYYWIIDYSTSS